MTRSRQAEVLITFLKQFFSAVSFPSGGHTASNTAPVFNSLHLPDELVPSSQRPEYLLSFALILQTLGSALLALTHSLVMLMIGPKCTHSSGICDYLVFQDPSLSLLAVIMLIVMAMLQVRPCKMPQCSLPLQLCSNLHWLLLLLFHRRLSPGAQVWAAAVTGRAPVHLCVWSRTEDWEHPRGAGSARPPHLAIEWIHHGGVCSCALPSWFSSTQVKRKCWCLWQPFILYPTPTSE